LGFAEERFNGLVNEEVFETKVRVFVSERIDDLAGTNAAL